MNRSIRGLAVALLLAAAPGLALAGRRSAPRGWIEAGPSPTPIAAGRGLGTATVTWRTSRLRGPAQVRVSLNGGPEHLFACGRQGRQEAPWIAPGQRYEFRLYPASDCSPGAAIGERLADARVSGEDDGSLERVSLRPPRPSVGANKFDLALQYLGIASGGDGSPAYLRVTRAMARKAILDARDAGSGFVRVAITGYGPVVGGEKGDLALWLDDPEEYWKRLDLMADDLENAGLRLVPSFVWNSVQFPALAGERLSDLVKDPSSASYALLRRYVGEFIRRYKDRDLVEFYELTNELNLSADLDLEGRCDREPPSWDSQRRSCAVLGNYTTDEMVGFTTRLAAEIRALDPTRRIGSGYGYPQAWADHMRRRPEWLGADWTPDSVSEFKAVIARIHTALDIVSVHAYNGGGDNERFGLKGRANAGMLDHVKAAADAAGQLVYVGEIGDQDPDLRADPRSPFTSAVLAAQARLGIPYSSPWVWEFYQWGLLLPEEGDFPFHLEPGFSDELIRKIRETNAALGHPAPSEPAPGASSPRVVLAWPLDGSELPDRQLVYATASAAGGRVEKVELLVDGRVWASAEEPPFRFVLDGFALPAGPHRLAARAYDAQGTQAEDAVSVTGGRLPPGATGR